MSDEDQRSAGVRLARLWKAADKSGVPLRTIIVAVLVVAFFYLSGKLIYRLRDVVLLMLVALGLITFGVYGLCEARWRNV